jgi:hypothetical protein
MSPAAKLLLSIAWAVLWPAVVMVSHWHDAHSSRFHWDFQRICINHLGTVLLWAAVPFIVCLKF